MKQSLKTSLFPWLPLLAGIVGFALQSWLFSLADPAGLLPKNHIAGILSYILLAAVLGVCLIAVKNTASCHHYTKLFPASPLAAVGTLVGGIGLSISAFAVPAAGFLRFVVPALGVLAAACLVFAAYCRLKGLRPNCLLYVTVTAYLLFRVMSRCQVWGAEPQLQLYFFPLLAGLFLLMASYYRAELSIQAKGHRQYIFFSQAALFCCCLCLAVSDWLFYLSAGIWMATDFCVNTVYHGRYT